MDNSGRLQFVDYNIDSFVDCALGIIRQGKRRIQLRPFNQFAAEFLARSSREDLECTFFVAQEDQEIPLPGNVSLCRSDTTVDGTILFIPEAISLSCRLMEYLESSGHTVIAPITDHYYKNKPLFLISIPKSGTHLLYELVQTFGYTPGVLCPDKPRPGTWYCVEYSNSHTSARDFFIDTVRRRPFGNRDHPFVESPAVFIYRNPLDVLVSEANYYHGAGKAAFGGYLADKSFEDRLLSLIDDPWLLGSIRDRLGNFIPWLEFQNVIPVSFEELIGPKGGGSLGAQVRLIWSLQLKLHIPGNPKDFGNRVFNEASPTFHEGQIGTYRTIFTQQAKDRFYALPQDFMQLLGFEFDGEDKGEIVPKRADEFRKRPVIYSATNFNEIPILVEQDFLGFNIVKYEALYYIIPCGLKVDLTKREGMRFKKYFLSSAQDLNSAKQKVLLKGGLFRTLLWQRCAAKVWDLGSHWVHRWRRCRPFFPGKAGEPKA